MTKKASILITILLLLGCNIVMAKRITPELPSEINTSKSSSLFANNTPVANLDLFQPQNSDVTPKFKQEITIKQSLLDILNHSIKE